MRSYVPHRAGRGRSWPVRCGRRSLLVAVGPELLEIGPEVGDVLVVLDADEGHPGAGHFLHRGPDIFRERLLAPGDAGRLVGRRIVEAFVAAGRAAVDPV